MGFFPGGFLATHHARTFQVDRRKNPLRVHLLDKRQQIHTRLLMRFDTGPVAFQPLQGFSHFIEPCQALYSSARVLMPNSAFQHATYGIHLNPRSPNRQRRRQQHRGLHDRIQAR